MRTNLWAGRAVDRALALFERLTPDATFRLKKQFYRPDMAVALTLLNRSGFVPRHSIDAGAYRGEWTVLCRRVFPTSKVLMIEPSPLRVAQLQDLARRDGSVDVRQALLGATRDVVYFREQESNSGVVHTREPGTVRIETSPLDAVVADSEFATAQLLKIDVQGYDLEVLKGAARTLQAVEVVIIEISVIALGAHVPGPLDVMTWLDSHGFRLLDICTFIRRPSDSALWQIDAVFVRKDSPLGHASRGW